MIKFLAIAALAALISGCAALGSDDQAEAGLTRAVVQWCDGKLCGIEFTDGKDKRSVALEVKHPSGIEVSYAASDVSGIDAIRARASVERAIADAGVEITPAVVDAIVKALTVP